MWKSAQAVPTIAVVGVAWAILTSTEPLVVKAAGTAASAIAFLVAGFWQAITERLPAVIRRALSGVQRVVTYPLVAMVILLGLVVAAYYTGQRIYLAVLFVAILLLVPPRLRWRDLLRRPHRLVQLPTKDLMADLEIVEGSPRPGPDGVNVVELPLQQGMSRNTFVAMRGPVLRDMRVELDVILKPDALLNVVLRYDAASTSGYMLRVDSRNNSFDAVLVMRNGAWGAELLNTTVRTPADQWVHLIASAQGSQLQLIRDGEILFTVNDGSFSEGRVGFFNEVADAAIRDVVLTGR